MSQKITLQHIFNLAWQKFIVEKAPPCCVQDEILKTWTSSYDDGKGGHCAVGLAIPSGVLEERHLLLNFRRITSEYPELFDNSVLELSHFDLIVFQDQLHDDHLDESKGTWKINHSQLKKEYRRAAREFKLKIPDSRGSR